MTGPTTPRTWSWPLAPTDVAGWLKLTGPTEAETDLLALCAAAVVPQVQRCRSDQFVLVGTGTQLDPYRQEFRPDDEVMVAALMLAGRLFRRRNSPGGIESIADSVTYVSRYDPEIERALRIGAWLTPQVG
jgi:hypothetical protein